MASRTRSFRIVRALDAPAMALPRNAQVGVAAIPGVRPGNHLLGAGLQAADQNIAQERIAASVVLCLSPT